MVDSYTFALAQRMVWVNHLLDDSYSSLWKTIEVAALVDFIAMLIFCGNLMPLNHFSPN